MLPIERVIEVRAEVALAAQALDEIGERRVGAGVGVVLEQLVDRAPAGVHRAPKRLDRDLQHLRGVPDADRAGFGCLCGHSAE